MHTSISSIFTLYLALVFFSGIATAQDKNTNDSILTKQIEFRHDNDFIFLTDFYYSSGLFISYRKILKKGITKNGKEQLDFTIGQEVYTPSQTQSTNTFNFDRPYAGFTGLNSGWSTSEKNHLFRVNLLLGIAGRHSGAGGFQRWYHKVIAVSNPPIWPTELANSIHVNTYFSYAREWQITKGTAALSFAFQPQVALGTRDIYLQPGTVFYIGKKNHLSKSIAYDRLGSSSVKELYVALKTSYRQVLYNGLIEGNLFGDTSSFVTDSQNALWRFGADLYHRSNKNDYKIGFYFNTQETSKSNSHQYLLLAYAYQF